MIVVIEKIVAFNSTESRLSNVQTADEVTVTLLHSQLLELLIKFQGFAVSRDEIFEKIFDINGAQTTNNNLNQNISALRKHLLKLGIHDEVITTVTRVGFMIKDSILIEESDSCDPGQLMTTPRAQQNNSFPYGNIKSYILIGTLIISIALTIMLILHKKQKISVQLMPENLPVLPYNKTNYIQGCEVNKLSVRGAGDDYFNDKQFHNAISLMKCESPQNTVFYISKNTVLNNNFRGFTLKCIKAISGEYDCYSFYESVEVE